MNEPVPPPGDKQRAAARRTRTPRPKAKPAGGAKADTPTEALIYISGLGLGLSGQKTPRGVVTRIAAACDLHAHTREATFTVQWREGVLNDIQGPEHVATLLRTDGDDSRPIIDVYRYEWFSKVKDQWKEQRLFVRAARTGFGIAVLPSFIRFFTTSGKKNPMGRAQLTVAVLLAMIMVAYLLFLVVALGQTALQMKEKFIDDNTSSSSNSQTVEASADGATESATDGSGSDDGGSDISNATWVQWVALVGAAFATWWAKARLTLETVGNGLSASASYLRVAQGKPEIVGNLTALIERLKQDGSYSHVRIVGYSFGSIVAFDTLYPTGHEPPPALDSVTNLVTIGSPYDFVRAVKPHWSDGRRVREGTPGDWLNVFSTMDLMGSNFKKGSDLESESTPVTTTADGAAVEPTTNIPWNVGIEPTALNILEFHGFANHGLYWGEDGVVDENVFNDVVKHLYKDTDILS